MFRPSRLRISLFLCLFSLFPYVFNTRLPSKSFMPAVKRDAMVNYRYQSHYQWPFPLSSNYFLLQSYMMPSQSSNLANIDPLEIAKEFATIFLTTYPNQSSFVVKSHYRTDFNLVTHVYLRQIIGDYEVY
jgi:hypothetical protein